MLKRGEPIATDDKNNALIKAAEIGKIDTAKALIDQGANLDAKDKHGYTPLYWAVAKGRKEMVELLVERGANIEAKVRGYTLLFLAVHSREKEIVKLLVEKRVNIDTESYGGLTPLHHAIEYGDKETVKLLLDAGADIEKKTGNSYRSTQGKKFTPLGLAITTRENRKKKEEMVKLLLDAGANTNAESNMQTPLTWALKDRDDMILKLLVEKGADIKAEFRYVQKEIRDRLGTPS